jgi:hypothetical protein
MNPWRGCFLLWVSGCSVTVTFDPGERLDDHPTTVPEEDFCFDEGDDPDEDGIPSELDDDDDGDEVPDYEDGDPCDPEVL